ncbi:MAG TPA: tetraacyldisaccharide 4'-kinase [Sutterella sp.]|nr:tetraacyldisaccharide 4'-kinase [Sutterella sp.]
MRAFIESTIHEIWRTRGPIAWLLLPASALFLAVSRKRRQNAKPQRLPVPVIVIGNIYVGGTGKTPVTIALAKELVRLGMHPGIISRGYGRASDVPQEVTPSSEALLAGDEPLLIAKATGLPVSVGRKRFEAGKLLLANHPEIDIIISDDGLQHYALSRDIEVAVVGARGLGNGWVLPAGPLRETPARLDEVDAIVLNATTQTFGSPVPRYAATGRLGSARPIAGGAPLTLEEIAASGKKVLAAAGIAAPERFFNMLLARGLKPETMPLPDHFDFKANPFEKSNAQIILITGKDAVKCAQNPTLGTDPRIYAVDHEIELDRFFIDFIAQKLSDLKAKPNA